MLRRVSSDLQTFFLFLSSGGSSRGAKLLVNFRLRNSPLYPGRLSSSSDHGVLGGIPMEQ